MILGEEIKESIHKCIYNILRDPIGIGVSNAIENNIWITQYVSTWTRLDRTLNVIPDEVK
jgi:hypothetical protein